MAAFGGGYGGGEEGYQFGGQPDRSYGGRGQYGDRSYGDGGRERYDRGPSYGAGRDPDLEYDELCHRMQMANRRMEQSSANSLRTLHDTLHLGQDTAVELDRQAEALDRTERRLDEMQVDLDQSKRHMRNIKSPFGGIANYFARRKKVNEITDPKLPKEAQAQAQAMRKGSSRDPDTVPPPSTAGLKGTGNRVVDENLDEMGKALHQLKGMGELIGEQLDDSNVQLERIKYKVDRTDVKIKGVNKDIKRQLY